MGKLSQFSLTDMETVGCPFKYYKAMRDEDPVHYDEKANIYIVSRHEDIRKALAQPLVFSSGLGFEQQARAEYSDEIDAYYASQGLPKLINVVTSDPPYHTRIRSLMDKAFTAHRVASMEQYIKEVADALIDGFIDKGEVEFVHDFAIPFPIFIIADQLAVPPREGPHKKIRPRNCSRGPTLPARGTSARRHQFLYCHASRRCQTVDSISQRGSPMPTAAHGTMSSGVNAVRHES
jgi:cytochrome P450